MEKKMTKRTTSDGESFLAIENNKKTWIAYSNALADILCWVDGFKAGLPEEKQHLTPNGIDKLKELNGNIKDNIDIYF
jgi:hypothetical protein